MSIGDRTLEQKLAGFSVTFAAEGSTEFGRLTAGQSSYEGCHIVQFVKPLPAQFLDGLRSTAKEILEFEGIEIVVSETKTGRKTWTLWIAMPRSNVLACATSEGELRKVLRRMKSGSASLPALCKSPAWTQIHADSRTWGIRLDNNKNGDLPVDSMEVVFSMEPGGSSSQSKLLVSVNGEGADKVIKAIEVQLKQEALAKEDGFIKFQHSGTGEESTMRFFITTLALLGHRVMF
jgi:hypothetical protein